MAKPKSIVGALRQQLLDRLVWRVVDARDAGKDSLDYALRTELRRLRRKHRSTAERQEAERRASLVDEQIDRKQKRQKG